jgi:membrane associated rhomboid family serine protease
MTSLAAVDRRDGLLVELLAAEPAQVVVRLEADVAVLVASTPARQILLLSAPRDLPEDRLVYALSLQVKTVTRASPPTHVVVLGGGPEVAAALKKAAPLARSIGFHHIDEGGRYAHVTGLRLPVLERVAADFDPEAPVDRARLGDAFRRGQALLAQERAVVARLQGRTQVTAVIMAVCAALTALSYRWGPEAWGRGAHTEALARMGANHGAALREGEVWRLFASAFLHANWQHLVVNMFALWSLGPLLEAVLGPRRYVLLYGAAALGGSLASGLTGADHLSVGASGAIWGLLGAAFGLALRPHGLLPPLMAQQMKSRAGMALLINLGISLVPGIDLRAHLGGGVVGFALMATVLSAGLTPLERRPTPADAEPRPGPWLTGAAVVMALLMALSIVIALLTGRPWELGAGAALRRSAVVDTG